MHQMRKGRKKFSNRVGKLCERRKEGYRPVGKETICLAKVGFVPLPDREAINKLFLRLLNALQVHLKVEKSTNVYFS